MKFQREEVTDQTIDLFMPLFQAHYKEIAHYQDIPLDPDREAYLLAAKNNALRLYTVRSENEVLEGYAVFFVRHNPHYRSSLQASQDILYLNPQLRGGMNGYKFIKWCDEELRREGVQVVYQHVKKSHNFSPVLERMGYELIDYIYGRRLN